MPQPTVTPINIHVGRGDVYIGVSVPAEGSTVPLTNGAPADGRSIGATLAPCVFMYRPTTFDILTQQSTGIVGYVVTEEDVRMEFEIGELTYQNLKDMFVTPKPQATFVSIGGLIVPVIQSALIVAPRRGGGFIEAMIYTAAFTEARDMSFNRAGAMSIKVVARAQALLTRSYGDQLGFVAPVIINQ